MGSCTNFKERQRNVNDPITEPANMQKEANDLNNGDHIKSGEQSNPIQKANIFITTENIDENIQVNEMCKPMDPSSKREIDHNNKEMECQILDSVTISFKTVDQRLSVKNKEFNLNSIKTIPEANNQNLQNQSQSQSQTNSQKHKDLEIMPQNQNLGSTMKLNIKANSPLKDNGSPVTIKDTLNFLKSKFRTESYYGASCFASILEENKNNPTFKSLFANVIVEENDAGIGEENEMDICHYQSLKTKTNTKTNTKTKTKTIIKTQNPFELFKNINELVIQQNEGRKSFTTKLPENHHKFEIPSTSYNSLIEKDIFNDKEKENCKENSYIDENSLKEEDSLFDNEDDRKQLKELNEAMNPLSNKEYVMEDSIV